MTQGQILLTTKHDNRPLATKTNRWKQVIALATSGELNSGAYHISTVFDADNRK